MSIIMDHAGVARALRKLQGKPERADPVVAEHWIEFVKVPWSKAAPEEKDEAPLLNKGEW